MVRYLLSPAEFYILVEKQKAGGKMGGRKYESDMTKKEKRELRRQQLKSTHGKARLDYIWTYYKLEMGLILVFVIIGALVINWLLSLRYDQFLYVGVINNTACNGEQMAQDYKKFIGNDNKFDTVEVDSTMTIDPDSEISDFYGSYRFTVYTSTSVLDAAIVDEETFESHKDVGVFLNLEDLVSEADPESLDSIVDGVGLDLQGNEKLASYGVNTEEPVYLMVNRQTENAEHIVEFIRFLEE